MTGSSTRHCIDTLREIASMLDSANEVVFVALEKLALLQQLDIESPLPLRLTKLREGLAPYPSRAFESAADMLNLVSKRPGIIDGVRLFLKDRSGGQAFETVYGDDRLTPRQIEWALSPDAHVGRNKCIEGVFRKTRNRMELCGKKALFGISKCDQHKTPMEYEESLTEWARASGSMVENLDTGCRHLRLVEKAGQRER